MPKRGRPKIYYDFSNVWRKNKTEEPLDTLLRQGIINLIQHKLALKLRWMFTVNFGLPTVQAYNPCKIPGRDIPKYNEDAFYTIRQEYKKIIEFLYKEDKIGAKLLLNIVIYHKITSNDIELIKSAAQTLEQAFSFNKKNYHTINHNQSRYIN